MSIDTVEAYVSNNGIIKKLEDMTKDELIEAVRGQGATIEHFKEQINALHQLLMPWVER